MRGVARAGVDTCTLSYVIKSAIQVVAAGDTADSNWVSAVAYLVRDTADSSWASAVAYLVRDTIAMMLFVFVLVSPRRCTAMVQKKVEVDIVHVVCIYM